MPGNAKRRHPVVEQRLRDLTAWAETAEINRLEPGTDHSIGILTSSTSYQYVKEVCGDRYPVLKFGMIHPLPVQKILDFAKTVDKLIVVEELDGVIETHCRTLGLDVTGKALFGLEGELSQNLVSESSACPSTLAKRWTSPSHLARRSCARAVRTGAFSTR